MAVEGGNAAAEKAARSPGWRRPARVLSVALAVSVGVGLGITIGRDVEVPREAAPVVTLSYGAPGAEPIADRVGDLRVPDDRGPHPVAVVIHGGFWRAEYGRDLMDAVSADLARRGWASWNIEYRRVGAGGGWPETFDDVAAAVDQIAVFAGEYDLDPTRTVTVGHSAGGHLALWAALRQNIPAGMPGATPLVRPRLAIGQAAVADLRQAAADTVGGSAVVDLMGGGPDEVPERYAAGSPFELLPAETSAVLVHGAGDDIVPLSLSEGFVHEARQHGGDARLATVGGGHFEHLDPTTEAWAAVLEAIEEAR